MDEKEVKTLAEKIDKLLESKTWTLMIWEENKPGTYITSRTCTSRELFLRILGVFQDMILRYSMNDLLTSRLLALLSCVERIVREDIQEITFNTQKQ